jgi:hypothetical protein
VLQVGLLLEVDYIPGPLGLPKEALQFLIH